MRYLLVTYCISQMFPVYCVVTHLPKDRCWRRKTSYFLCFICLSSKAAQGQYDQDGCLRSPSVGQDVGGPGVEISAVALSMVSSGQWSCLGWIWATCSVTSQFWKHGLACSARWWRLSCCVWMLAQMSCQELVYRVDPKGVVMRRRL